MESVRERLAEVHDRLAAAARRAGRDPARVRLVAVAKTAGAGDLQEAWQAGQRDYAHNRVQALERDAALLPAATWHLIGPLQSNKTLRAVAVAQVVQTVGEARTAARLAAAAQRLERTVEVLVQINLTPQDGRYGCAPQDSAALLELVGAQPRLPCRGLMTIAPLGAPPAALRRHFAALRELAAVHAARGLLPADPVLSMGMSEDFEIAVAEGANLIRLGRAIFPSERS